MSSESPSDYRCICNDDDYSKFCTSPHYLVLLWCVWAGVILLIYKYMSPFAHELLVSVFKSNWSM